MELLGKFESEVLQLSPSEFARILAHQHLQMTERKRDQQRARAKAKAQTRG